MNDLQYTHEKFWSGSKQLLGSGPMSDRLVAAVLNHVCHAFDNTEFLPQDLRDRITDLRRAVNAVADDEHGSVSASVTAMTANEIEHWAAEIFNISVHVAELVGYERAQKGLPAY